MSYLVSDYEAASVMAAETQEFGRAHSDQAPGTILGAQVFTRLMEADSAADLSARHIKQVMDAVPQHMFILEPDGTLSFINRAAREYLGPIDAVDTTERLRSIIHLEDVDELLSAYDDAMTHGISVEAESRVRSKNGQYRWFLHQLLPLHDENGQIVRWCGTRIDIEDLKNSKEQAQQENLALREEIDAMAMFEEIVGTSPRLQAVLARVTKVARTDSTVLITGETGTGKELIARAIHKHSNRANRPFVSVNCAAIPRDLITSELFGHEKGAFTGALQRRIGRFELAEGGTLFLDEIGELPAETQVALL
ncbi:MAG: sigma 54-interacting transcriptional regulator, partial [Candidatus Sulfotelmatobacter sp.]